MHTGQQTRAGGHLTEARTKIPRSALARAQRRRARPSGGERRRAACLPATHPPASPNREVRASGASGAPAARRRERASHRPAHPLTHSPHATPTAAKPPAAAAVAAVFVVTGRRRRRPQRRRRRVWHRRPAASPACPNPQREPSKCIGLYQNASETQKCRSTARQRRATHSAALHTARHAGEARCRAISSASIVAAVTGGVSRCASRSSQQLPRKSRARAAEGRGGASSRLHPPPPAALA